MKPKGIVLATLCLFGSLNSMGMSNQVAKVGCRVLDEPEVIESCCVLRSNGLCSARYLFDSVVTNVYSATSNDCYVARERGFVDLNGDGHEDVILSEPVTSRGTGGLVYGVYLWTNGLYKCMGDVFGNWIRVERTPQGSTAIWSYSHCSACSGSFCRAALAPYGTFEETHLALDWAEEGESCIARSLDEAIMKHATVPIRWEISRTVNGTNVWCR